MNLNKYILDENKNPVVENNLIKWATWYEKFDNRVVAKDKIGEILVSTIFLGLDHSYIGGAPVLWETMIFGGIHDEYEERYTSYEDAVEGHARAVKLVTDGK